jgi:hypothetical protein
LGQSALELVRSPRTLEPLYNNASAYYWDARKEQRHLPMSVRGERTNSRADWPGYSAKAFANPSVSVWVHLLHCGIYTETDGLAKALAEYPGQSALELVRSPRTLEPLYNTNSRADWPGYSAKAFANPSVSVWVHLLHCGIFSTPPPPHPCRLFLASHERICSYNVTMLQLRISRNEIFG